MELNLKKIDWRLPPHELKANIDGNFTQLSFALKNLRGELDSGASKLKCEDNNLEVTEPKGVSLIYGLKLSNELNVGNLKGKDGEWKSLKSKTVETESINTSSVTAKEVSIDGKMIYHQQHEALVFGANQDLETGPQQKTRFRLSPKKDTSAFQSFMIESAKSIRKPGFQNETTHFVVKGDGNVGVGVFHKLGAKLTLSGKGALLCLKDQMTPTAKEKKSPVGTFSWDDEFLYIKTNAGWKKSKLDIL